VPFGGSARNSKYQSEIDLWEDLMAPSGAFSGSDLVELVDLLDRTVLRSGIIGRMLRGVDGVVVRPVSDNAESEATISRPGLFAKSPLIVVDPPRELTQDHARSLIAAAGIEAPHVRKSSGMCVYEFDERTTAEELVAFALGALRAVGAHPPDDRWMYEGTAPEGA
jgi:hypothetical protein